VEVILSQAMEASKESARQGNENRFTASPPWRKFTMLSSRKNGKGAKAKPGKSLSSRSDSLYIASSRKIGGENLGKKILQLPGR
jgi:hypothetical protein